MSRYNTNFSVVMLHVEKFDEMVSEHGRFYGDHMLQKLARLLDDFVRETDVATRCGGQEFVVVMPETSLLAHVILPAVSAAAGGGYVD